MKKTCNSCKKEKDLFEYGVNRELKSGLCSICKECNRSNCKAYRAKNLIKVMKKQSEWRKNNTGYGKQYRQKNLEKIKERDRAWIENNRAKFNAIRAKQRAIKNQRLPKWADLKKIFLIYYEAKAIEKKTGIPQHVDHVIPLKGKYVSGLHVHNNLQVLTAEENLTKRNYYAGG